jgi:hypothetical protein
VPYIAAYSPFGSEPSQLCSGPVTSVEQSSAMVVGTSKMVADGGAEAPTDAVLGTTIREPSTVTNTATSAMTAKRLDRVRFRRGVLSETNHY